MHKNIFVIFLLTISCLPFAVKADKLSNGANMLYGTVNGGGATLQGGGNTLRDSKAEPIGGKITSGGRVLTLGILGMLGGETISVTPTAELSDTGKIRATNITREGENLALSWDYDAGGPYAVKIYVEQKGTVEGYVANDAVFSSSPVTPMSVSSGTKIKTINSAAHDGYNYYYRVVPDPLPTGTLITSESNNSITVGKVEIPVPVGMFDFVALPFMEDNYYLKDVIGEQLGDKAEYYFWDVIAQNNPEATYSGGAWTGTINALTTPLRMGDGFYVRANSGTPPIKLALAGRFGKLTSPFIKTMQPMTKYNLIANPYPLPQTLETMGVTVEAPDDQYKWINYQKYDETTYTATGWDNPSIDNLEIARPRFYRPHIVSWVINP